LLPLFQRSSCSFRFLVLVLCLLRSRLPVPPTLYTSDPAPFSDVLNDNIQSQAFTPCCARLQPRPPDGNPRRTNIRMRTKLPYAVTLVLTLAAAANAVWTCPSEREPYCCTSYVMENEASNAFIGRGCRLQCPIQCPGSGPLGQATIS
jgi:hypothetical protein